MQKNVSAEQLLLAIERRIRLQNLAFRLLAIFFTTYLSFCVIFFLVMCYTVYTDNNISVM